MLNATGRYWGSAHTAKLTEWSDGEATVVFTWADGAAISCDYATHADARSTLRRLGFAK